MLRVLTKHFPAYKDLAVAVEYHLSHPYWAVMRQKSEQVRGTCVIIFFILSATPSWRIEHDAKS